MKVGEGEGKEGNFLPHPLPALLLTPFFARSLTPVPRSLLLNRTKRLLRRLVVVERWPLAEIRLIFFITPIAF